MTLREDQIQRYARHILLREVGGVGQARLLGSRVLVAGSAGAEAALVYLAAAGVGTLGLLGAPDGLDARLRALNPDVAVTTAEGSWDVVVALGQVGARAATDAAGGAPLLAVGAPAGEGVLLAWLRTKEDGCPRCATHPWAPDEATAALAGAWAASEVLLALLGHPRPSVVVLPSGATRPAPKHTCTCEAP